MYTFKVIKLDFDLTSEVDTGQFVDAYVDGELIKLPLINPFCLVAKKGYKALIACDEPNRIIITQVEHQSIKCESGNVR